MELKEFIAATITAIAEATSELQQKFAPQGIVINPPAAQSGSDVFQQGSANYTMRRVQSVKFDVAVTAASVSSLGGGAGVKVLSMEVGGKGDKTSTDERVTRVQFEIPMTFKPSEEEGANTQVRKARDDSISQSVPTSRRSLGAGHNQR